MVEGCSCHALKALERATKTLFVVSISDRISCFWMNDAHLFRVYGLGQSASVVVTALAPANKSRNVQRYSGQACQKPPTLKKKKREPRFGDQVTRNAEPSYMHDRNSEQRITCASGFTRAHIASLHDGPRKSLRAMEANPTPRLLSRDFWMGRSNATGAVT